MAIDGRFIFEARSDGTVAGGGGAPAYGGEIQRDELAASTISSFQITLPSGISAGNTVIVSTAINAASVTMDSVADDRLNIYKTPLTGYFTSQKRNMIVSAYVTTALQAGDKITVTLSGSTYTSVTYAVFYATGCAVTAVQWDQNSVVSNQYGSTVSAPASTTAANTLLIGVIGVNGATTYGSGNWTTIGAKHDYGTDFTSYYIYKVISAAGSQDPGGTLSEDNGWAAYWMALK